jgi:hypothetical protein
MKWWSLALLCALVFVCSSCTNIKNKKVTDENKDKVMSEISNSKELTDDERQLLAGYIMRQNLSTVFQGGKPEIPTGKTVGEMIEDQRKWVTEEAAKEKAQKEEAALRELVTVTLYSLKEEHAGFMDGFEARIAFKAGDKDIRAFEGDLALSDVLGNSLGDIPVKVLKPLKANESGTTSYSNAYIPFPELRGKHLEDIKAQWKPTKMILADSTELTVPTRTD